jgi:hypothetical protein
MIVDKLDFKRVSVVPAETDTKLVVYADAVLTLAVAVQRFQAITRRGPQIL